MLLLLFLLLFVESLTSQCLLRLTLDDTGADGWNSNFLTLKVGDQVIDVVDSYGNANSTATLSYGSMEVFTTSVDDGDDLVITYHGNGKYQLENVFTLQLDTSPLASVLYRGVGSPDGSEATVSIHCCCEPPKVTGLTASQVGDSLALYQLSWTGSDSAIVYRIYRRIGDDGFKSLGDYPDRNIVVYLEPNRDYYFQVAGINQIGVGSPSDVVLISTPSFNTCELSVVLLDAYGDGWDEGYLNVKISDGLLLHATSDKMSTTYNIQVPAEGSFSIATRFFPPSEFAQDCEYVIMSNQTTLYRSGIGSTLPSNTLFTATCDTLEVLSGGSRGVGHGGAAATLPASTTNLLQHRTLMARPAHTRAFGASDYSMDAFETEVGVDSGFSLFADDNCVYDLIMFDWYGDGWRGSGLSVYSNGRLFVANLSVPANSYRTDWYFQAAPGTRVELVFRAGTDRNSWDAAYEVLSINAQGNFDFPAVVMSPPGLSQTQIPGTTSFTVNCGSGTINNCPTNCQTLNRQACRTGGNSCGDCLPGYSSRSTNPTSACQDIDECQTASTCDRNARCTNFAGSYNCTCNAGFSGDGTTCRATTVPCPSMRLRKEWLELTAQEKDLWARGLIRLRDVGRYRPFVEKHASNSQFTHGFALFLPWHRAFLKEIEDAVRSLGGEFACVTMPYWDWTNSGQARTQVFTGARDANGYWLGFGSKNTGGCVTDGPYSRFTGGSAGVNSCIDRDPWTNPTMPNAWTMATNMAVSTYTAVRPAIETAHNNLHGWVGGIMALVQGSVSDPIFLAHHAFVDQLWAAWQDCMQLDQASASRVSTFWETASPYAFTATMPGYQISAFDAWDITALGYQYSASWVNRALLGGTSFRCLQSNRQWLQQVRGSHTRHLFENGDGMGRAFQHPLRGRYRPHAQEIAKDLAVYEDWKDDYLKYHDALDALEVAVDKLCHNQPLNTHGPFVINEDTITMMNLEEECAQGYCVDPCWKRTIGQRDNTDAPYTRNATVSKRRQDRANTYFADLSAHPQNIPTFGSTSHPRRGSRN